MKLKQRDVAIALLILLLLLVIFRRSKLIEHVESKIYYGKPGEKPPWKGKIGDVVEWGGKQWAWTESPVFGADWFEIIYYEAH